MFSDEIYSVPVDILEIFPSLNIIELSSLQEAIDCNVINF